MNAPNLTANGLPFLGQFLFGHWALLVILALDFVGPATFLYALWRRKTWGPWWAAFYIGVFIINGLFALVIFREQLGLVLYPVSTSWTVSG